MIGLGLSIVQIAVRQLLGDTFSPASLFSAGEQGAWWDPSDMSTLFQDSAGTLPVTAVEQPVGLMLDKSGRGNHAFQSTSASRPVLSALVNLLTSTETLATQTITTNATTQRLRFEGTGSVTLSGTATGTYSAGSHTFTTTAGSLTLTVSGSVTKADLRASNDGVGLPAYQRVNTSTNYDTAGFPMYLRFDGVDDGMVTNSINFTSTDKMTVWAGVRKLSDAAPAMFLELSASSTANSGSFYVTAPEAGSTYGIRTRGSGNVTGYNHANFAAPITNVISTALNNGGLGGTPANCVTSRFNSIVNTVGAAVTNTAAGNFGNYPLFIARRNNASLPFNGRLHSLIVRGAQSTAEQIAATETYVNSKTKAFA